MADFTIKVLHEFRPISNLVKAAIARAVQASAVAIEQDVKGGPHSLYRAYPPVPTYQRTGNLGRSYIARKESDLIWVVENDVRIAPYAIYVEFGTRYMPAKPHLKPSAEAERRNFEVNIADAISGVI